MYGLLTVKEEIFVGNLISSLSYIINRNKYEIYFHIKFSSTWFADLSMVSSCFYFFQSFREYEIIFYTKDFGRKSKKFFAYKNFFIYSRWWNPSIKVTPSLSERVRHWDFYRLVTQNEKRNPPLDGVMYCRMIQCPNLRGVLPISSTAFFFFFFFFFLTSVAMFCRPITALWHKTW